MQPSVRSTLSTPESTAGTGGPNWMCSVVDHPFTHASVTIGMTSEVVAPSASPPPDTVGALVTEAGAVLAVLTVTLMSGYVAPGASASERVHVVTVHVQPSPEAETGPAPDGASLTSGASPVGSASATVTVPEVGSAPLFFTRSVSVAGLTVVLVPSTFNSVPRLCVAEIDRSVAAIAGDAVTSSVVAIAAARRPGRPNMQIPPLLVD